MNLGKVVRGNARLSDPPYDYGTSPTQANIVLKAIPEWRACKIEYDENTPVMKQTDIIRFFLAYSKFCYEPWSPSSSKTARRLQLKTSYRSGETDVSQAQPIALTASAKRSTGNWLQVRRLI